MRFVVVVFMALLVGAAGFAGYAIGQQKAEAGLGPVRAEINQVQRDLAVRDTELGIARGVIQSVQENLVRTGGLLQQKQIDLDNAQARISELEQKLKDGQPALAKAERERSEWKSGFYKVLDERTKVSNDYWLAKSRLDRTDRKLAYYQQLRRDGVVDPQLEFQLGWDAVDERNLDPEFVRLVAKSYDRGMNSYWAMSRLDKPVHYGFGNLGDAVIPGLYYLADAYKAGLFPREDMARRIESLEDYVQMTTEAGLDDYKSRQAVKFIREGIHIN